MALPLPRARRRAPFLAGTWIDAGRPPRAARAPDADHRRRRGATAEVAGRRMPGRAGASRSRASASRWTPRPLNAQSWMGTTFAYWEGPIRFTGSHAGRGYLEMTGYDDARRDRRERQRAGRAAEALLVRPDDRLLPRRLLQHRARGPRPPHGLRPDDRGVPRLLPRPRQRPLDPAARVRLPRPPPRRPLVPLRRRAGRRPGRPAPRRRWCSPAPTARCCASCRSRC